MVEVQVTFEVPKGRYCRYTNPLKQTKTCPVLGGYSLTYCQIFQTSLKFDFEVTEEKTSFKPLKCLDCLEAMITDEES